MLIFYLSLFIEKSTLQDGIAVVIVIILVNIHSSYNEWHSIRLTDLFIYSFQVIYKWNCNLANLILGKQAPLVWFREQGSVQSSLLHLTVGTWRNVSTKMFDDATWEPEERRRLNRGGIADRWGNLLPGDVKTRLAAWGEASPSQGKSESIWKNEMGIRRRPTSHCNDDPQIISKRTG